MSAVLWAPQERPVKLVRKAITQQTLTGHTKVGQPERCMALGRKRGRMSAVLCV